MSARTDLVQVEAHEGFILLSQFAAQRRLVLGAESRFLFAQHALADHAHLRKAAQLVNECNEF